MNNEERAKEILKNLGYPQSEIFVKVILAWYEGMDEGSSILNKILKIIDDCYG